MFKMFPWVPDGIYDNNQRLVRYEIVDGTYIRVIAKLWVDAGGPADVSPALKQPWGTYPDLPQKPSN